MIVYRGMRARDFARMLQTGQVGEYVTTDPALAVWYARLWAEVHRDPEPGVVAVFEVDPNRLMPDEYGYEAGARNVEFRLEDFRGIAGADGFEPGDKAEVLPGRRGFDSPGLHHPPWGTPFGRGPQARSTTPSCRADSPHSGGLPGPQDGPETSAGGRWYTMEDVVVIWDLAPEAGKDFRCEYEYCNREPIAAVQVPGMRERKFCIFHVPPWAWTLRHR